MHRPVSNLWSDYYDHFPYFSMDGVRSGCHPRKLVHAEASDKAIVLVHGLTDSPYFLNAIADYFHTRLKYDVYLPLLHGHGLKDPQGMEQVEAAEWQANVGFAIRTAAATARRVSIGGLSTGGTLSFLLSCKDDGVSGDLYLFSAALDLAGGPMGLIGEFKEWILKTPFSDLFDSDKPLIGRNPYRYDRMDVDGARELAAVMEETDALLRSFDGKTPFTKRVFASHSRCDATADIQGVLTLQKKTLPDRFIPFFIEAGLGVSHASLVLDQPIMAMDAGQGEAPLEAANPVFDDMMAALSRFEQTA